MMEAVARKKTGSFLNKFNQDAPQFNGTRPQEDIVTSAVFGSIRLLPKEDRRSAIKLLLGHVWADSVFFATDQDIDIFLWKRLFLAEKPRLVEPDVLLRSKGMTIIVEVKWHAPLTEHQLALQAEAAIGNGHQVLGVVLLGGVTQEDSVEGVPCFSRTWRDVARDLQAFQKKYESDNPLDRWAIVMGEFLSKTDVGNIFSGLPVPSDPGEVAYRFSKPGHTPWLDGAIAPVEPVHFQFGG